MANQPPPGRPGPDWLSGNSEQQDLMNMASRLSFSIRLSEWQDSRPDHSAMAALAAEIAVALSQHGTGGIGLDTDHLMSQLATPQIDAEWNPPAPPSPEEEAAIAEALAQVTGHRPGTDPLWFG